MNGAAQVDRRNDRLSTLDALRGVASLGVCWFHFTHGNVLFLTDGWIKASGTYGWTGVECFFVISGFIIPYAMQRACYHLSDFGRFALKRITRVDPPYLVNIVLVIVLGYISAHVPGYRGSQSTFFSARQLLLHLGYLNSFTSEPWINPVYWTLGIEAQWYVLIGLIFPITRKRVGWWVVATAVLLSLTVSNGNLIFPHLPFFLSGFAVFRYKIGDLRDHTIVSILIILLLLALAVSGQIVMSAVGFVTALAIAFLSVKSASLNLLGTISYSLYLVHVPIGGRVINLGERLNLGIPEKVFFLCAAVGASIAAAYFFYALVEKPAQVWSTKVKYSRDREKSNYRVLA